MVNKIESAKSCTTILDAVYQREVVPGVANSPARFMLAGMNAKIACAKKLFNEMSTSDVRYHNVATYEDLLGVMGRIV